MSNESNSKILLPVENEKIEYDYWFPGRWVGGISMTIAPIVFLTGMLLRIQFHFFFPQQLLAFKQHPTLIVTAYNFFLVGNILLWPAIITLARLVGQKKKNWATWGGTFIIFGLFARTFHGGENHLAFQLVRVQGLELATKAIADSYGAFNIISTLNGTIMFGWLLLSIGSYLSGTLNLFRSIALGLMTALMSGVLKGSSVMSVISGAGLCIALVPLGIKVLNDGPLPRNKEIAFWSLIVSAVIAILYFLGQAG